MTLKIQVSSSFSALPLVSSTVQFVTDPGTTAVLLTTQALIFKKSVASASPCTLPSGILRDRVPLEIYDFTGVAGDITLTPYGTDSIMGANAPWTLTSGGVAQSGARGRLIFLTSIPGWVVQD